MPIVFGCQRKHEACIVRQSGRSPRREGGGLVLLAATNDLSIVDPAVIRPGRFDLKIPVGNPDRAGIRDILADHLHLEEPCAFTEADLEDLSAELVGATGAAVAAKAREAMSRARSEGRPVARSDLLAVLNRGDRQEREAHLRRLAVHEAGHPTQRR